MITEKNEESLGDSQHGISGKVENKGGATARDVVITAGGARRHRPTSA